MSDILPEYLKSISTNVKEKKQSVSFNLICDCGCEKFQLLRNIKTPEENKKQKELDDLLKKYNGNFYGDTNGHIVLTTRGFLGLFKKKLVCDPSIVPFDLIIYKVKCQNCGKEYIIFNNTLHGYDGYVDILDGKNNHENINPDFKLLRDFKNDNYYKIKVKIINSIPYNEFLEELSDIPNITPEDYSNAFSSISIYIEKDDKLKNVFSCETQ